MWKTIDKILNRTLGTTTISELMDRDTVVNGQDQTGEKLNEHFVNVGPKLTNEIEVKPNDDPTTFLHSVDANKKISFKIMSEETQQDATKIIAKPLAMIFNASLAQGIFPNIWKLAKITPIFKSGARNKKNN